MKQRHVALAALLAANLPAQGPVFPVGDLLASKPARAREISAMLVRPAMAEWPIVRVPDGDSDELLRHVVSGEGHLLSGTGGGHDPVRRPVLGEDALLEVLAALVPSAQGAFRVTQAGESFFVRARRAPELLEAGLGTIRAALPPDLTVTLRLERVRDGAATPLLAASESVGFGDVAVIGDVEHSALVADLNVEIAQAAMTSDPVVAAVTRGASALLRARALPGRHAAIVEVVTRSIVPFEAAPMPSSNVSGSVDRVASRIDQAGLAFRVERGVESVHEWASLDGSRLRLRCRADWPGDEPAPTAPLLCSPLLREPILGFRGTRSGEADEPRDSYSVADFVAEEFEWAAERGEVPVRKFGEGSGAAPVLYLAGEEGKQLASRIADRLDDRLASRRIAVEVFDVAPGAQPGDSAPLWQFAGPVIVGLPSCFASGREQTYMRDWDVEVAQSARMPDPKVSLVEEGWFATAKVLPADARGARRVQLALDVVRLLEIRKRSIELSPPLVGSTSDAKIQLPREEVSIEQPVTRAVSFDTSLALDAQGGAEVRRVASGLLGPGHQLVLLLRVE